MMLDNPPPDQGKTIPKGGLLNLKSKRKGMRPGPLSQGKIVGRWRLLVRRHIPKSSIWLCMCDCLTIKEVNECSLQSGYTQSCGCQRSDLASSRFSRHGESDSLEYKTWQRMKNRCQNPNDGEYEHYGARGITVCERWQHSYKDFVADVGHRPSGKFSIDRIDNARGYEPGNVRWATPREQQSNRRNNRLISFHGETKTCSEWARTLNITPQSMFFRLKRGPTLEYALRSRDARSRSGRRGVTTRKE